MHPLIALFNRAPGNAGARTPHCLGWWTTDRRRLNGFSFLEILLVLGLVAALALAAFITLKGTDVHAEVRAEQANITDITMAAERAFGKVGSFEGLSNARLIEEGLVPAELVRGNTLQSAWGHEVQVRAEAVNGFPNSGLRIDYADVPAEACSKLATAIVGSMFDIEVDGVSVLSARGEVDPQQVARRCGADNEANMSFVYYNGAMGELAIAPPLDLPCPPPEWRPGECPAGEFGYIREERHPICDADGTFQGWGAWTEKENTCDPNVDCVAEGTCPPIGDPPPPPSCKVRPDQQRNLGCPPGQVGVHLQERKDTCPDPLDLPEWGPWVTVSNTCTAAPGCPASETRAQDCPAGLVGTREQQRDCINPGPPVQWGDWYDVVNTCESEASPETPPEIPPYNPCIPEAPQTRQVSCPSPQLGRINERRDSFCSATYNVSPQWTGWYETGNTCYECPENDTETRTTSEDICPATSFGERIRERQETRTRSYNCPEEAGPPTANAWSAWTPSSAWVVVRDTCYSCPAPQERGSCPAGQTGTYIERRTANCTDSGWSWNAWVVVTNTCVAVASCPEPETRMTSCPAGQDGVREQQRDGNCPGGNWDGTWGAWYDITNTCAPIEEPCVAPPPETRWVAQNAGCPAGQTGSHTWEAQEERIATCAAATGPYTWGGWAATGATRNEVNTCAPSVTYQWERRTRVHGPGFGCHYASDVGNAEAMVAAGTLIQTSGWPYPNFEVNEANKPCNSSNAGEDLVVYGSCGGWQDGIEGESGFQCEASDGSTPDGGWD